MSSPTRTQPDWATVLAEVEADVARTEELLRATTVAKGTVRLTPVPPAELMLPGSSVPRLPDPALMPRVPVELLQRITALRERMTRVGEELTAALEDISAHLTVPAAVELTVFPSRPVPRPKFLDRAL